MTQQSRQHHFVPAMLLSGFTDSGNKKGRLWEFDGQTGKRTSGTPKKLGKEFDYHAAGLEGVPIDLYETFFGKVENRAAPVLHQIAKAKVMPTDKGFEDLLVFLALMLQRGPAHRNFLNEWDSAVEIMKVRMALTDRSVWDHFVHASKVQGRPYPQATFDELRTHVQNETLGQVLAGTFDHSRGGPAHTQATFELISPFYSDLKGRNWGLAVIQDDQEFFVTSDSSVTIAWDDPEMYRLSSPGLGYNTTELAFPINRRVVLLGRYEHLDSITVANSEKVAEINARTATLAARYLYGPQEDFSLLGSDGRLIKASDWFNWYRVKMRSD